MYIGVAETDRLRVLQSPQGALRSPYRPEPGSQEAEVDPGQPMQVLKLYERLLPFADLVARVEDSYVSLPSTAIRLRDGFSGRAVETIHARF